MGFTQAYQERLRKVTIESYDVLKVMKAYDSPDAFFYLDPPYVSSDKGHYKVYSMDDFTRLLDFCSTMQGKFLLSSYPEAVLMDYRSRCSWFNHDTTKTLAVDGRRKEKKTKVECLT